MRRLFSIAAALLTAISVLPLARGEEPIVVPLQVLSTGHVAVTVKINGKGPYRLIYDVGAPVTIISSRIAAESGLIEGPNAAMQIPLLGLGMGGVKMADTFEVGDVKVANMPLIVVDHPTVQILSKAEGGLEGLVGFTFFARYRTIVDYQKNELIVVEPSEFEPEDSMERIMGQLLGGRNPPKPPLLGVRVTNAERGAKGVSVAEVTANGPADRGGIKVGDLITTLNNRPVVSMQDFQERLSRIVPGQMIFLKINRDGQEIELAVKTAPLPPAIQKKVPRRSVVVGITIEDTKDNPQGARVMSVTPGSAAAAAGLRQHDVITGMGKRWVLNAQDFYDGVAALYANEPVLLKVLRDGKEIELQLRPRPGI